MKQTLRLLAAALGLVAALVLSGCSGDSDSASDDAGSGSGTGSDSSGSGSGDSGSDAEAEDDGDHEAFDVCGLLTPADLEAQFGSTWDAGEATHLEQTGGDQCVWGNTDAPPVKTFSVAVMREGHLSEGFENAGVTVESLFNDTKELMGEVEDLDLGDDAYLSGSTIAVLDGDTSYDFSTFLGTSPEAIAGLRALAAQVVG